MRETEMDGQTDRDREGRERTGLADVSVYLPMVLFLGRTLTHPPRSSLAILSPARAALFHPHTLTSGLIANTSNISANHQCPMFSPDSSHYMFCSFTLSTLDSPGSGLFSFHSLVHILFLLGRLPNSSPSSGGHNECFPCNLCFLLFKVYSNTC